MLGEQLNSVESRNLLSTIDKMRKLLHDEKVNLPEIVVVGDQSVGKSSVLEAISGIQLPRAQNICTRCPLELRMKTAQDEEYATIRSSVGSVTEKNIDDLTKIADEVTRLTSEIAGTGLNVSPNPIYLTVYKRDILYDLTLIDLPGITRNALPGQAENIHQQILDLINKYIKPPTAGISEKLQGRGSGSMDLQLGCIAVLNRNQDEIDRNISFSEMKQREKQFFITHKEAFEPLPDEFKGSEQLVRRLATIQQERIRSTFPDIIKKLKNQLAKNKAQLKKIPPSVNTEAECWTNFQSMINAYRESIHDNVKGEYDQVASMEVTELPITCTDVDAASNDNIDSDAQDDECEEEESLAEENDEDHIAYHIYQLQRKFQNECRQSFPDFFSSKYHKIVLREIDRTAGVSLPNFPSYQIIVGLFRKELQKLPHCCHALVKQMHEYMSQCLLQLFEQAFNNDYPRLKERLKEIIIKRLDDVQEVLMERVNGILDMEKRVFTLNHYYMDTVNKFKEKDKKKNDAHGGTNALSASLSPNPASTAIAKKSPGTVAYASMSNEAQAAQDIQIALHAYSKVKYSIWFLIDI
ncbi:unnamed protein product [Rotaria sp. Silwood1]|nr:unnamed protein product [Rotaria sp. Silwood1]